VYEGPYCEEIIANQRKEHNVEKYIQWVTTLPLTVTIRIFVRLALLSPVASQICEIPTFRENSKLYSS